MTQLAIAPVLVAVVGLVLYGFGSNKIEEVGRISFFSGLFVTLLVFATTAL